MFLFFSFWIRVCRTFQTERGEVKSGVLALTRQQTRGFLVFVSGPKTLWPRLRFFFFSQLFFHPCHQVCQRRPFFQSAAKPPPLFQLGHLQLISHFLVDFSPLSLSISSLIPFGLRRISNRGCFSAPVPPRPHPDCKSSGFHIIPPFQLRVLRTLTSHFCSHIPLKRRSSFDGATTLPICAERTLAAHI